MKNHAARMGDCKNKHQIIFFKTFSANYPE